MKKKVYEMPTIKVEHIIADACIMAASGNAVNVEIDDSDDNAINSGYVDAKSFSKSSLWDDNE